MVREGDLNVKIFQDPWDTTIFGPNVNLNKPGRGALDVATIQILRVLALRYQTRRFLCIPIQAMIPRKGSFKQALWKIIK